jgi:NAD(P)-dependent dehydrogenase (short-subunit alcohol dehydrogenase family)/rhamnose utilization protein RhaD (predicted bifunctional aldolase and dehydrogenase)
VDNDLKDMLNISNTVGKDPRLVQGGGGNTSVKTDGGRLMYVKASGTSLAEMREGAGYRLVDVGKCIAIVEEAGLRQMLPAPREAAVLERLMACCADELKGRPSVETSLHAMLGRCVVHSHPSVVNGLLCARNGRRAVAELFGSLEPPCLYIEYCGAGFSLAVRMQEALAQYRKEHGRLPEVVFLENHGLFVTCDDADRALELTRQVFDMVEAATRQRVLEALLPQVPLAGMSREAALAEVAAAARRFYGATFGRPALVRFSDSETVMHFLRTPGARDLSQVNPLTPDHVVYCKDRPVWVELPKDVAAVRERVTAALKRAEAGVRTPVCLLVAGLGLFSAAPGAKFLEAASATMEAVLETLTVAAQFGGAQGLADSDVEFLHNWEIEQFRRGVVLGEQDGDDLAGKVAVVTGAGSGLGRGISLFLARKGVHTVLADIDREASAETSRRIQAQGGPGGGYLMWVNVTDERAVADLFQQAVRELGGMDILVNCAGIAPVHPLTEFPLDQWRKAVDINLTGYFLVAREAARCMVRQRTGGSIINLSSKTGLDASKHHSAYNATKAAEIHLARGWALDLAEYGIRVNAICPGNVFKESKIWNEDYIKALAQKRGIKPEDVIPYYVGLTALKQEVTWDDVGEAVAFLCSARAAKITGQTLVVDAGQVFVR